MSVKKKVNTNKNILSILLSNKMLFGMIVVSYLLLIYPMLETYLSRPNLWLNPLIIIYFFIVPAIPFHMTALIFGFINMKKYQKKCVVACTILSFLMPISTIIINMILGVEGQGLSNILLSVLKIQSILLIIICLLKLFLKNTNFYISLLFLKIILINK